MKIKSLNFLKDVTKPLFLDPDSNSWICAITYMACNGQNFIHDKNFNPFIWSTSCIKSSQNLICEIFFSVYWCRSLFYWNHMHQNLNNSLKRHQSLESLMWLFYSFRKRIELVVKHFWSFFWSWIKKSYMCFTFTTNPLR